MTGATVGFFGKLPSHGDFLERRVAAAFRDRWDEWLQHAVAASREALGERWLASYLVSPVWRFFLGEGLVGGASYAGILVPSVDRVGRYFPFTVVAELPTHVPAMRFAQGGERWLREVESLVLDALQASDFDLQRFDAALLESLGTLDVPAAPAPPADFPSGATHWRFPIASAAALPAALAPLLYGPVERSLRPLGLWWTDGSEQVRPSALLVRGLPEPRTVVGMLSGDWQGSGWHGASEGAGDLETPGAGPRLQVRSAAATDAGPVRSRNEDHYVASDALRLWAVADGMGGHGDGDVASRMVAAALDALEPAATLSGALQAVRVALERVNRDLRRPLPGRPHAETPGATVVVLAIDAREWGVAWAGDSRAYLLRDGVLHQLTRDHSPPAGSDALTGGVVTRAVGGEDALLLEQVSDAARAGDRFLLCSDGLYNALGPEALAAVLSQGEPQAAVAELIDRANRAGARDNVTAVVVDAVAVE